MLAQLSDPHVEVGRGDRDSARALAATVDAVLALRPRPHAVVVSGDLVNDVGARHYERVRELLAPLPMPVFVLAGNHDDRDALREYFALAGPTGKAGEPFRYSAAVGELRLVGCDTTIPGRLEGSFDADRRLWLEAELAAHPQVRRVVCGHVHRTAFDVLGGCGVFTCPSTYLQAPLELGLEELELVREPAGFALHAGLDGAIVTHVQPLGG